jgi:hypothetical protein
LAPQLDQSEQPPLIAQNSQVLETSSALLLLHLCKPTTLCIGKLHVNTFDVASRAVLQDSVYPASALYTINYSLQVYLQKESPQVAHFLSFIQIFRRLVAPFSLEQGEKL